MLPMGGGLAPVEQAGGRERERADAHRCDARAPLGGVAQRRADSYARVVERHEPGDDHGVRGAHRIERRVGADREPGRRLDEPGLLRADRERVAVAFADVTEDLRRDRQVEGDDFGQR